MKAADKFLEVYSEKIKREGAENLLKWLKSSDFLKAPASTRFHLSREGGLAEHSLNVYRRLVKLCAAEPYQFSEETLAICGLLHDVCKADFYRTDYRNSKDESGKWVKVPYYAIDDQLPYGHGEKSVYIISGFMRLSREESMAIRWHMGGFDESVKGGSFSLNTAFQKFPLAVLVHAADLLATNLDERHLQA
ncbi:MAG: HD domain-containing protein [Oscillospiraceae bacterium]|nr:HD domain-containing protein [Oscillospiraceae bacterium]